MHTIKSIDAYEILDSRGNPTVRVSVKLSSGIIGTASVPSGASTGAHEALELRDGDKKRYGGLGVLQVCENVNTILAKALKGKDVTNQREIDECIIKLDGTPNKSKLGANALLGVSLACAHAGSQAVHMPLYRYIRKIYKLRYEDWRLPTPTMNIINGGRHADSGLQVQEFMIIPKHPSCAERIRMGAEIFHTLQKLLHKKGFPALVGDEGGFAPNLLDHENMTDYITRVLSHIDNNEKALTLIVSAIKLAGFTPGKDVFLGIDAAASEFYDADSKTYTIHGKKTKGLFAPALSVLYQKWITKYPFLLIEDPLAEDDWDNWKKITKLLGKKVLLVGDDLFVTNTERLQRGIDLKVANAILIKLNQIGTLSQTIDCIVRAQKNGYAIQISHRSGETQDTTIADLSVAIHADYIKTGSLSRSERVEKYNRLIEIERELISKK